jgi:hypothetical protein
MPSEHIRAASADMPTRSKRREARIVPTLAATIAASPGST